ncbi:hypothetical protein BpHYR1_003871 [Brachionus plicatilis]|uniref:Uncharacterized protein n=1 Tax=Brachionus plicatilis TaxID=10195 RepID=A0A3M7PGE0_BRAPC|nr:hypothetical protein BpHYR1_003871 [Brachionus plicatilis]
MNSSLKRASTSMKKSQKSDKKKMLRLIKQGNPVKTNTNFPLHLNSENISTLLDEKKVCFELNSFLNRHSNNASIFEFNLEFILYCEFWSIKKSKIDVNFKIYQTFKIERMRHKT